MVHVYGGRWVAFDVKLGGEDAIEQGAATLKRLRDKIDADRMRPPSALAVITAFGYAYTRPDGVHVIPIGCLRD